MLKKNRIKFTKLLKWIKMWIKSNKNRIKRKYRKYDPRMIIN